MSANNEKLAECTFTTFVIGYLHTVGFYHHRLQFSSAFIQELKHFKIVWPTPYLLLEQIVSSLSSLVPIYLFLYDLLGVGAQRPVLLNRSYYTFLPFYASKASRQCCLTVDLPSLLEGGIQLEGAKQ